MTCPSSADPASAVLRLRPYQVEALERIGEAFLERGRNRLLVSHPTGAGKTVLFASLLRHPALRQWIEQFPPTHRQMVVLAHREELLEQAAAQLRRANPDLRIGFEQGGRTAPDDVDVVLASVASVGRGGSKRLARLTPARIRLLVIDEAHHAAAPVYQRVLQHFGWLSGDASRLECLLLGVTATPERADGIGLGFAFDEIVHRKSLPELIKDGVLSRLRAYRVTTAESLDGIVTVAGDFELLGLSEAINRLRRNELVVASYQKLGLGRPTLVFAVSVAHAEALAAAFEAAGFRARAVSGNMSPEERRDAIEAFRARQYDVLVNCMLLTEGFDCPSIACVIQARPTKSSVLYRQMIGRGTRLAEGKDDCIIVDIVDNTTRHELVTAPSLMGMPPQICAEGDLVEAAELWLRVQQHVPDLEWAESIRLEDLELVACEVPLWDGQPNTPAWVKYGVDSICLHVGGPRRVHVVATEGADRLWQLRIVLLPPPRPAYKPGLMHLARIDWRLLPGNRPSDERFATEAEARHAGEQLGASLRTRSIHL